MKAIVSKSILKGSVKAIASKSHAHRILICAALADKETYVVCEEASEDIKATVDCLIHMGANISKVQDGYIVKPIKKSIFNRIKDKNDDISDKESSESKIDIDCNESGSTLRFLLPVVCAMDITTSIYMKGRLPNRPLSPLYEELIKHGATISEQGVVPLVTKGVISSGEYILPANISSQYISGLLFALPLLQGDSVITLTDRIESKSYIDMTINVLRLFNIDVVWEENKIFVKGNQAYISPEKIVVEGDWSNIAFWLCAGAVNKENIRCTNLNMNSLQGDKAVVDILEKFGAKIIKNVDKTDKTNENMCIDIKKEELCSITIDANNIPDLVPILAMVASVAKETTTIINAQRLRLKESDRIESVANTLNKLGADISKTEDGMIIKGQPYLKGGEVDSYNDHRIAMMASIAALVCEDSVIVNNAQAVNKSYSSFYDDYIKLGGNVTLLDN